MSIPENSQLAQSQNISGYTFVSVSTAKPGKLDELIELARRPSEKMDGVVPGMIARQTSVDRNQNTVIVWATFDCKESLYDYLATEKGSQDHGETEDMSAIDTFTMYDLTPISEKL